MNANDFPVLNISTYRFCDIEAPQLLRDAIGARAQALALKGTVLIAPEGINLFLAGAPHSVRALLGFLREDPRFADLAAKESWSKTQPFGRLRVKVKPEIIRMNHPMIRPAQGRAPAVDAPTVARWLAQGRDDAGREVVTLDTRNAFEVDFGSFPGAIDWRINKFSEFPEALLAHRAELEGKTVVSFCTGGIRCEKAALYMQSVGIENVWQLEGGILKYFEETGGAHFKGRCFVFDEREAVATDLSAAATPACGVESAA